MNIGTEGYKTDYNKCTFVKYPDDIEESTVGEIIQINSKNIDANVELIYNNYVYVVSEKQKTKMGPLISNKKYWLASPCVYCASGHVNFSIRNIGNGEIGMNGELFTSYGTDYSYRAYGIRAIIYI